MAAMYAGAPGWQRSSRSARCTFPDGPLAPIPCAGITAYRPCEDCPNPERFAPAAPRDARKWRRIAEVLAAAYRGFDLAPGRKKASSAGAAVCRSQSLVQPGSGPQTFCATFRIEQPRWAIRNRIIGRFDLATSH